MPMRELWLRHLPPYSDLNPTEQFFAELKACIKENWKAYEDNSKQGFDRFLDRRVDVVACRIDY